jgi:Ser/Thr protein kinase RdoA (MazF antagonist)
MAYNQIKHVLPHFCFRGTYADARELHSGNINNTYLLEYRDGERLVPYTLQRINTYVFKNPQGVMQNIAAVTEHLRRSVTRVQGSCSREVLELVRTINGDTMFMDAEGGAWRAYAYITDALALDRVERMDQMEEVGLAFGRFQRHLADFPVDSLFESIPDFHHTIKRFFTFVRAVEADKAGRVSLSEDQIEFMFEHWRMMGEIVRLLERKVLPLRVTHNDTKANNVLLDRDTGKALCVIDLDTVMPGSSLYDYGDAIRFGASTAAEDEEDTRLIGLDMGKTRAFTRGFIQETAGILSEEELMRLPLGIKVMTCELAMRFLTDYLDGDLYFKVNSPQHNLIRAKAQIALLQDVEKKEEELNLLVRRYISRYT